jgi:enamine deaminase RidA (YjgF/YER057c/UK114 family)
MIRALSLAAALALLPLSAAVAETDPTSAETALEAAAEAFEARMESFGERAEAIQDDESLSEIERDTRIAALWAEYQPAVDAFTAAAAELSGAIAAEALAGVDMEALVAEALRDADIEGAVEEALEGLDVDAMAAASIDAGAIEAAVQTAMAAAPVQGLANGAWAQTDPEQMVTYGLIAEYGMNQALSAMDEAETDAEDDEE